MTLPYIFSNQTQPDLTWLDVNFEAVGALTIIPCALSGTNTIVLTPAANTPTITAYTNYLCVAGIIAVDNSGVATANYAGLGSRQIFKDTVAGPVALSGAELQAGNYVIFSFDSALDSGTGGWHVQVPSSGSGTGTVTSIATNAGLTGGTITTTGTIGLATIANQRFFANVSGGTAVPSANSITTVLDSMVGNAEGTMIVRTASTWAALAPGYPTQDLSMNSVDPSWGLQKSGTIAAAGSVQGDAAAIGEAQLCALFTTGAGTGVILPATTGRTTITVINRGANNLKVYPNSGAQIESLGVNAADTVVATTGNAIYACFAATGAVPTQWYRTVAS